MSFFKNIIGAGIPIVILWVLINQKSDQGPKILQKDFLVTEYGAISDGTTVNTKAIQSAIDAAHKRKGGRVVFPKGEFISGSIELKNGVELYLKDGGSLLGSTNPSDYRRVRGNLALILGDSVGNIAIRGKGTIDGQGRKLALTIDSLHHIGQAVDPNYNYRRMRPHESVRPELINLVKCRDVRIEDVTLKNSAGWLQTLELCSNVIYDGVTVYNRAYWNNDGFDIVDCTKVLITNCDVDAADDGICLKSHNPGYFNDQITITNNKIRSSASAIKFGTASHGGFKNVIIDNIQVFDTFRSAIAIESVDGGEIENISVTNVTALNTGNAIFIRLGHRSGEKPGSIKNITIKNVKVEVPFGRPDIAYDLRGPEVDFFHNPFPSSIVGIEGHKIENIVLENIEINYPGRASKGMAYVPLSRLDQVPEQVKKYPEFSMFGELPAFGLYIRHAKGIKMKNVRFTLDDDDFRPAFVFDDVEGLLMEDIDIPNYKKGQIILKEVKGVQIEHNLLSLLERY